MLYLQCLGLATLVITPLCIRHGKAARVLLTSPETGPYRAYELRGAVWFGQAKLVPLGLMGEFLCPFYVSP